MHTPRTRPTLAAGLATIQCLLLGACASDPAKHPGSAQVDPLPGDQYPKIAALDGLSRWIAVSGFEAEPPTATRPIQITTSVRAMTDGQELNVQYRYMYFDNRNSPLNPNPDWQYVRLPSRAQVFLRGSAMDTSAVDWRLEIRPAR